METRSEESAEAVVVADSERRAEQEGKPPAMSLGRAAHQKPGELGRAERGEGDARPKTERDEARLARQDPEGLGRANLLMRALARENLVKAWQRVKTNKGSAGVDGLSIKETAEYLKAHRPQIRED